MGRSLPHGEILHTEEVSVPDVSSPRKSLPCGRVFCADVSSSRKTLPGGRPFLTEDASVRKSLPCGRLFRTEESSVRKSLLCGSVMHEWVVDSDDHPNSPLCSTNLELHRKKKTRNTSTTLGVPSSAASKDLEIIYNNVHMMSQVCAK